MPTRLHEVLAVEGGLDATQKKMVEEAKETFSKRADHFIETHRELQMFKEEDQAQNTVEHKAMVTTVGEKLEWVAKHVAKHFDVVLQKEATNQTATADVVIDGATIAQNLPATMLLGLESRLAALRDMYLAIPTLSPGKDWEPDPTRGRGVWRDRNQEVRSRTQKVPMSKVLYDATKEHPAQIEKWFEDAPVGRIVTQTHSGMLSVADKSDMLERLDLLIQAVKRARQRANRAEVDTSRKIGDALMLYIHGVRTGTAKIT